jgi:CBS domain-containing protein
MLGDTRVQDSMTFPPMTVTATSSVRTAQQVMSDYNIRHLPVVKGTKLVGILSSGDIRRASPSSATTLSVWEYLWEQVTVEEVMTERVITVTPETPMLEAVRLMLEHRFNCLPVVDAVNQLVGILTEVDVFRLFIQTCEGQTTTLASP